MGQAYRVIVCDNDREYELPVLDETGRVIGLIRNHDMIRLGIFL